MTAWVDEGRAVSAAYLDFSKAFDTVSHYILIGKLRKCGLDERSVQWIGKWLNGRHLVCCTSGVKAGPARTCLRED